MINQRSAEGGARQLHKNICQSCINKTAFPVDGGKRSKQQRKQRHHRNNKKRLPQRLYFSIVFSGKKTTHRCDTGTKNTTGFLRGYRLLLTRTFAWRSFTTGTIFPLVFYVETCFPVFWYTLPIHAICQTKKSVCNRASVCVLLLVPILLARAQTMSMCPNSYTTTLLEAGDEATRNAAVWLFLAQYS